MCTRYVLLEEHYRAVLQRLGIAAPAPFTSRYNIGPGAAIPVIRTHPTSTAREAVALPWGWTPLWARAKGDKQLNVRAETLARRGPLREALAKGRCIVPATGFFEWQKHGRARQPFLFRRRDGQPFGLAALWRPPSPTDEEAMPACAVITTDANAVVQPVHARMPSIVALDDCEAWLDPAPTDPDRLLPLLRPLADTVLVATPVHPRMNHVRYEAPDAIDPLPEPLTPAADRPVAAAPASPSRRRTAVDDGQFTLGL